LYCDAVGIMQSGFTLQAMQERAMLLQFVFRYTFII
jgi:hypothetical protein